MQYEKDLEFPDQYIAKLNRQLVDADLNISEHQSLHWTAGCEKHMQNGWTGPGEKEWACYMWKQTQQIHKRCL